MANKVVVSRNGNSLRLRLPRGLFHGKQKYIYLGLEDSLKNRKIAEAKAQQIELDILFNNFDSTLERYRLIKKETQRPKLTLEDIYNQFIEAKKTEVRPGTFKNGYKVMLNHLKKSPFAKAYPEDKNLSKELSGWAKNNLTRDTARRFLTQLNACINWGIDSQLINLDKSPFEGLATKFVDRRLRQKREIDPFSREQRDKIIDHYRNHPRFSHYHLFVSFCFQTGCRTSEAIALEKKNILENGDRIIFSHAVVEAEGGRRRIKGLKTQEQRTLYCSQRLKQTIKAARAKSPNNLLFPGVKGGFLGLNSFRTSWKVVLKELGIKYRIPYQMRHTFITLCLEAGINAKDVAKMVGNSPEMIYRHYAENTKKVTLPEL